MVIEDLTTTHADLEAELGRFRQLLDDVLAGQESAVGLLKAEIAAVQTKLEREIESEAQLEQRADEVLGEGAMNAYHLAEHQAQLRSVSDELSKALADEEFERVNLLFGDFIEHFEAYTRAEWDFLHSNSSVLFPGGTSDG